MNDLQRLLATDAIRDLQARDARAADEKRWGDVTALFFPTGDLSRRTSPAAPSLSWPDATRS